MPIIMVLLGETGSEQVHVLLHLPTCAKSSCYDTIYFYAGQTTGIVVGVVLTAITVIVISVVVVCFTKWKLLKVIPKFM